MDFKDYFELTQLYADYAAAVDSGHWDLWPEFFTDECSYRLQPRENHERGFPLATLSFESKGMLKDRVYGIRETLFHDPYYQRHVVGAPIVRKVDAEGRFTAKPTTRCFAPSCRRSRPCSTSAATIDEVVRTPQGLKFASRLVVYDSEMIPNSIIYPI